MYSGAAWLNEHKDYYDVIITDSSDPVSLPPLLLHFGVGLFPQKKKGK